MCISRRKIREEKIREEKQAAGGASKGGANECELLRLAKSTGR
jgi:hypothetical protein